MTNLFLAVALLVVSSGPVDPGPGTPPPTICRATLKGQALVTEFQAPSGYRVEGWWTLVALVPREGENAQHEILADLLLDSVLEWDMETGRPASIPLTLHFHLHTGVQDPLEAMRRTVSAWCTTLKRAEQQGLGLDQLASRPSPLLRI